MPKTAQDDNELNDLALAWSTDKGCSYTVALEAIVELAKHTGQPAAAAVEELQNDQALNEQLRAFSLKNTCSYTDALRAIVAVAGAKKLSLSAVLAGLSPDDVLHQKVLTFAHEKACSYVDALRAVVAIASLSRKSASFAETHFSGGTEMSDHHLAEAALRYAAENMVSFSEALAHRAPAQRARRDLAAMSGSSSHAPEADLALHRRVLGMVEIHNVSYAEALFACAHGGVSFAEKVGVSSPLSAKAVEIFKVGTHIDANKRSFTFTKADLVGMVVAYDPKLREAPLTLGHTSSEAPAYGWVKSLAATDDGKLVMDAHQVNPDFARAANAGHYKKRSAAFYEPTHPNNPKPGFWYLRHVAWLGAEQPAIYGLKDHKFGAA